MVLSPFVFYAFPKHSFELHFTLEITFLRKQVSFLSAGSNFRQFWNLWIMNFLLGQQKAKKRRIRNREFHFWQLLQLSCLFSVMYFIYFSSMHFLPQKLSAWTSYSLPKAKGFTTLIVISFYWSFSQTVLLAKVDREKVSHLSKCKQSRGGVMLGLSNRADQTWRHKLMSPWHHN